MTIKYHDVHNWSDIERSMSEQSSVLMRVPYDMVQLYGVPYMKGLVDKTQAVYGAEAPPLWIDCSIYPGVVMSAIRHGLTHLIFSGEQETYKRLREMMKTGEIRYTGP